MPRRLIFAPRAREDLAEIGRWLTQRGSGQAARRLLAAIRADINLRRRLPCLYPTGQHAGIRECPCAGGYRALYRVDPDTGRNETAGDVVILRVFGPGQSRG